MCGPLKSHVSDCQRLWLSWTQALFSKLCVLGTCLSGVQVLKAGVLAVRCKAFVPERKALGFGLSSCRIRDGVYGKMASSPSNLLQCELSHMSEVQEPLRQLLGVLLLFVFCLGQGQGQGGVV